MYIKHKDRSPEQTVKIAKSILSQWDIKIKEEWHDSEIALYSVTLYIENTDFFTNGKGTDKAYALASAYGEMMERIQNLSFFRLSGTCALRDNKEYGCRKYLKRSIGSGNLRTFGALRDKEIICGLHYTSGHH